RREPANGLEADQLEPGPEPKPDRAADELLERVAAREPLVRESEQRRAEPEAAHWATSVFERSVTYSSGVSGPIRMYGMRSPSLRCTSAVSPARTSGRPTRSVAASSTNHISSQ